MKLDLLSSIEQRQFAKAHVKNQTLFASFTLTEEKFNSFAHNYRWYCRYANSEQINLFQLNDI